MFIQTERTPNPRTLKFLPGTEVSSRLAEFTPASATEHPFLADAFAAAPVENVFIGHDFVSVTLSEDTEWPAALRGKMAAVVQEHLASLAALAETAASENSAAGTGSPGDAATVEKIIDLLDTRIRPAVAMDGGDIVFESYSDGVLTLTMKGACSGCPSSTATLRHGVQNLMRHYIPEIQEVRAA